MSTTRCLSSTTLAQLFQFHDSFGRAAHLDYADSLVKPRRPDNGTYQLYNQHCDKASVCQPWYPLPVLVGGHGCPRKAIAAIIALPTEANIITDMTTHCASWPCPMREAMDLFSLVPIVLTLALSLAKLSAFAVVIAAIASAKAVLCEDSPLVSLARASAIAGSLTLLLPPLSQRNCSNLDTLSLNVA